MCRSIDNALARPQRIALQGCTPGAGMNNRAKLMAALGASATAGAIVAALMLTVAFPAASHEPMGTAQHHANAAPLCGSASDAVASAFYSEMSQVNARMHAAMDVAHGSNVDRDFMRMMIPHHQGAIDMALVLLKYGRDEKLKRLAQSIIVEQGQEMTYM